MFYYNYYCHYGFSTGENVWQLLLFIICDKFICDESFSKIMLNSINQQYSLFHHVIFLILICDFWNENNLKFLTALELLVLYEVCSLREKVHMSLLGNVLV